MYGSEVYDLCVIGAGMFGAAAARHASANAGLKVCLIGPDEPTAAERPSREIFSAHYDEARITRIADNDPACQIFCKHSISRYREIERLSGIPFYTPVGSIFIGKKGSAYMKDVLKATSDGDVPVVDLSYNDVFKKRYPYLRKESDDLIILDDAGSGHISARKMVAAQKKVAQMQGCEIISEVVNEVSTLDDGTHKVVTENNTEIRTRRVLIATGAFTNFKNLSIPQLKLTIAKETAVLLEMPESEVERLSSMPSIIYSRNKDGSGAYVLPPVQYPNGNYYLKIGHSDIEYEEVKTLEEVKEWYLSKGNQTIIDSLSKFLIGEIPGLKVNKIDSLTCVTAHSPSSRPYIDCVTPTVTVAVIGNGKGAKFSDEIGRIAAHLSLTGQWDSEVSQETFKIIPDEDQV